MGVFLLLFLGLLNGEVWLLFLGFLNGEFFLIVTTVS